MLLGVRHAYTIRTPENVEFELELAGLCARCCAWLVDMAVIGAALVAFAMMSVVLGLVLGQLAHAIYLVALFVVQWGYFALMEWGWSGQTVGKRLLGLRVIQAGGGRMFFTESVVRNLVRIADMLPLGYLAGGLCALVDDRSRRLGDLAAGTVVVAERRAPRPAALGGMRDRHNSFWGDRAVARASRRVTAPERDAMLGLAMRRESLPLPVRHELFSKLARHLQARLGVQRPQFSSEEKFVLNLTAVVVAEEMQETPQAERRSSR